MTSSSTLPPEIDRDTVRAVVGRVDRIEADLAKLDRTVTALSGAIKGLLATKQEQAVQPDWLTVDKPTVAQTMLLAAVDWTERHGATLGLKVQPCWPWHPQAVAVLLAATHQVPHQNSWRASSKGGTGTRTTRSGRPSFRTETCTT